MITAAPALEAQGLQRGVPSSLSDAQFWQLMTGLSEPGGRFPSDNFASNEMGFPNVLARLRAAGDTGGAYIGVGPEQNFTYIATIHPAIAFVVDIRRQAIVQHLLYKAIFELSKASGGLHLTAVSSQTASRRARRSLYGRPAVGRSRYWTVPTDTTAYARNLARITARLVSTHAFPLDSADRASLAYVYRAFYEMGPVITYSSTAEPVLFRGFSQGGGAWAIVSKLPAGTPVRTSDGTLVGTAYPIMGPSVTRFRVDSGPIVGPAGPNAAYYGGVNFAAVTAATDVAGGASSFLATEENYHAVKTLEERNRRRSRRGQLHRPVRAAPPLANHLRDRHTTVTAFYTSNVSKSICSATVGQAGSTPTSPRFPSPLRAS